MRRSWIVAALILVALLGTTACQQRSNVGPAVNVIQGADFKMSSFSTVAFLGLGKSVREEGAIETMEPLVEEQLTSAKLGAIVIPRAEAERRAQGETAQLLRDVRDYWRDDKKVDQFKLRALCDAISVDGVVLGSVEDWTRDLVSWGAEGTSFTRVSLSLSVFAKDEVQPRWHARSTEMMESSEHEPSEMFTGRLDPGAQRRANRTGNVDPGAERAQKAVPEPPPLDEVGRSVVVSLVTRLAGSSAQ